MSSFNQQQISQLLKPINPNRVLADGKGHSHVSQQDITAHLIRVFGFGGFDTEILDVACIYETERVNDKGVGNGRWDVCYRALLRLTIRDAGGAVVARYEDGSTATAQNQTRGDAHDLAYKSALSLSKKRAAINLGDQFGLSLYNKGQKSALVIGTMINADGDAEHQHADDIQDGVSKQVSLGNDEVDPEMPPPLPTELELGIHELALAVEAMRDDKKQELHRLWQAASLPAMSALRVGQLAKAWQLQKDVDSIDFDNVDGGQA